ncbi:MAG: tetratricopeptide repeat protein [Saprospiraceae bacterium]|nr:tetratricopeptide repeat protein [Saprospiraceae bacterium]
MITKHTCHICLFLLCLLPHLAWPQSGTDSLERTLQNAMPDSVRLKTLLDIVWYNLRSDLDKAQVYADSAAIFCKKTKTYDECPYRVAYSYGMVYRMKGEYQKALEQFTKFKNHYAGKGDKRRTAMVFYQMAAVTQVQGEMPTSLDFYQQALTLNQEIGNDYEAANILNGIGSVYRELKQYSKAIEKQREALAIFEGLKDTTGMAECFNNIGNNYGEMGQPDTALMYFEQDFELSKRLGDEYAMAFGLENMGRAFQMKKVFERSEQLYRQSLDIRRKLGHLPEISLSLNGLGQLYNENSRFNQAINLFRESLQIARQENMRPQVKDALAGLSQAFGGLGRFEEALLAEREFAVLKDSILNEETAKQLAEMDARFEASEKEKALAISNLSLSKRTVERNWLIGGAALLGLLSLAIFFGLRYQIRADKKIAEQAAEIQTQRIQQLEQENKLTALSAMLEGQEKERTRIANDLHDSLGGLLASIKSHFNAARGDEAIFSKTTP